MIFSSLSQVPGFKRQGQRLNLDPGQVFAVDVARITGKERGDDGDNRPTVNHWLRKVGETGGGEKVVMEPKSSVGVGELEYGGPPRRRTVQSNADTQRKFSIFLYTYCNSVAFVPVFTTPPSSNFLCPMPSSNSAVTNI